MDRRRLIQLIIKAMGATSGLVVLEDDSLKRLAHALTRPSTTDTQTVSNVEARTNAFYKVEEQLPARLIRTSLTTHLDALSYLLINGRYPDPIRRRLMSTAGEATVLAGWLAFDLKDSAAAQRLYALAIDAARNVGDDALFACALAYMSYAASAKGDAENAIRLLEVAQRYAKGDRYAATRAWLSGREAEEQAKLGNSVAALRALDVARTEFEQSRPADERSWTNFLDDVRLKSLEIHALTRLGLPSKARTAAIEALAGLPNDGGAKKHSIVLADIATAQLQLGNLDEACELAARALEHAQRNECSLAIERLRGLGPMLRPWEGSRAAAEIIERLRNLHP